MTIDLHTLLTHTMNLSPHTFSDQVVVVTGAGRGIGLHTARAFALLGAKVILAELSEEGKAAEEAICAEGGTALFVQTDVSDTDSVKNLYESVLQAFGSPDVLVNNAIFIRQARVTDLSPETWERTIAVNLHGTFLTCHAFLPGMLQKNQGVLLNMISTDAMPGLSAYIASKAGITGFTQSLALELEGSAVRAIPFAPGMVDTPGIRSVANGLAPQLGLTESQFLNLSLHADYDGLMPPEHAAAAAVFLVAHLAETYHGQVVTGYEVLEKAGILQTAEDPLLRASQRVLAGDNANQALYEQLSIILDETEAEIIQLPVFIRPMARHGFKQKTGMSLPDWQHLASSLVKDAASQPANFAERVEGLATYFREAPKETARFTKDEATLLAVAETARARLDIIDALVAQSK
jgi:NAD(P)-dependent dehydrogenase (short-subunit alcohol dehydrogenase family)